MHQTPFRYFMQLSPSIQPPFGSGFPGISAVFRFKVGFFAAKMYDGENPQTTKS